MTGTNIVLSERLRAIAALVRCESVSDIGSDHALLPIFLIENGRVKSACAVEINEMPYRISREAVEKRGLSDKITVYKGNGLAPLENAEGTAVIAGMGGMLIIDILSAFPEKRGRFAQLILQPQHDIRHVRRFLLENGYIIDDEDIIYEEGKYYFILSAVKGLEEREFSEAELLFGRILQYKHPSTLRSYLEYELSQSEKVLNALKVAGMKENVKNRLFEVSSYVESIKGVLICLSEYPT